MQRLTAAPRDHLTDEQVFELLTGDAVEVSAGLELLDSTNGYVDDISEDLVVDGSKVSHDGRATIHRSCSLKLQRTLAWGRDRVRPYVTLSNAAVSARFNLGVFVLTTPRTRKGEEPATWDVTGYDLLSVLDEPIGDTYVVIPDEGENPIPNSDFESGITGWESNWLFGARTPATLAPSTQHPTSGTKTLEVTWPTTTGETWVNTFTSQFIVGKTYRFEADVWVPLDGPDEFKFEVAFVATSEWFVPTKGATNHFEWLWTATVSEGFPGLTTRGAVAGRKTWIDKFRAVALSTTCLDAVRTVIDVAGGGAPLLIDGTEQVAALPGPMVWALTDGSPVTWLQVANDLLGAVNYRPLWVDENGTFRSEPYLDPKTRPVEWVFDVNDIKTTLVGQEREIEEDVWSAPNWWRFVRRGMATPPIEGNGLYTVENLGRGASSQRSRGRIRRRVMFLDAVDQAALQAQGDRIVVEDTSVTRTVTLSVDPWPVMGHLDVVDFRDGAFAHKAEGISGEVCLDGAPGRFVLEVVD